MKRVVSILLTALFLLAALPLAAMAADYTVTVNFNDGGRVGYNTYGSSTDFDEIVSGGTFTVGEGNGLTVAALPNEGYILTDIRRNNDPIDPNLVYTTEDGLYVVDYGDVRSNQTIGFTFEVPNGVNTPFEAQGEPPAQGEPRVVNVYYNGGGSVGYNTTGSSSDFTALASGDGFEVNLGSGMTVGALPDEGYTVTQIYFNWGPFGDGGVIASPIDASWVYLTDEGRFVVDTGNVENDVHLEFVFALVDGDNSFKPTGHPPIGPDGQQNFDTAIYFPLNGHRFGWDVDATFGSIGNGFVNGEGMLEIPATRGADVRIRIHPQQVEDEVFGPYYPHLGSIYYTDQNGEQFVPYYRMKDVTDPVKEAPYGIFVYEAVIQNVQDPITIGFTEDEWYGHIENELDPDANARKIDNVIDVDLITGERVFIPELAGIIPAPAGVYKVGDMPAELCDALVALGFSTDDDFIEVSNTEWGEPMLFTLLLDFDTPFETELVGEYDEPHAENLLSKIIANAFGNVPDESWDVPESGVAIPVLEQFDKNDGIAVFRFDYYFNQAMVQRRNVFRVRLQSDVPDEPIDFIYGDVDRDGDVTMKDVLLLRRYIAHLVGEDALDLMAADVDLDENATMKDVLYIRQYIAHLVDALPTVVTPPLDPFELPPVAL
ncbi:MAG: dockerin type I repeat-containing protein [Clostridia bacterium]|nr:dockerin type I repeat-containing protein [Clostridia bacterium]